MKQGADGYLYIGAASSSTTSYVFKWSTRHTVDFLAAPPISTSSKACARPRRRVRARRIRGVAFSYPTDTMDKTGYANAIEQTIATLTALHDAQRATGTTPPPHPRDRRAELAEIQRVFYEKRLQRRPRRPGKPSRQGRGYRHSPDEVVASGPSCPKGSA